MDTPLLWHIPLSHFNEKARWALDFKGIAHRRQVLGQDYLVRAWRATGQGKLPILFLDGGAISDSTRIIAALEQRYPEPPLYPHEPALRNRALELEDDFDETLGPALRASLITPIFRQDRDLALRVLTTGMPDAAYRRLRSVARIFPTFYRFRHKISDRRLENDRAAVSAALDRIERERHGRAYLVGASFTVADLTAASLLSPLLQPPEICASSYHRTSKTTVPHSCGIPRRNGRCTSTRSTALVRRKSDERLRRRLGCPRAPRTTARREAPLADDQTPRRRHVPDACRSIATS
jgi:glutathione S-transferase